MAENRDPHTAEWSVDPRAAAAAWELLVARSSFTLLMDLARPAGPDSLRLLVDEGMPDGDWVPDLRASR